MDSTIVSDTISSGSSPDPSAIGLLYKQQLLAALAKMKPLFNKETLLPPKVWSSYQ